MLARAENIQNGDGLPDQTGADRGDGERLRLFTMRLMPACDRVPSPAQILCQVLFHLRHRIEQHRVQVRIQLRQQSDAVALYLNP